MVQYSLVIVAYNCKDEIQKCINSIRQYYTSADVQIIVVDNASSDTTPEILKNWSEIDLILNTQNVGFAKGCNIGAEQATGELLLFLNPDTQLTAGSLEAMAAPLRQSRQVGAVGPLSNFAAGWQNLRYVYNQETMGDANTDSQKDMVARELQKTLKGQAKEVKLLIGFCLMIRRDLFTDIGMMDESLVLGMDDLDISWRLKLLGKQLIAVYDAFVFHTGQVCFDASPSQEVENMKQASRVAFSKKLISHYGSRESVPNAWDLWEVDWFELEGDAEIAQLEQQNVETESSEKKDSEMGISFCVLAKSSEISRKAIENTIDSLLQLGVSSDDIVVVNAATIPLTQTFIDKDVFEWNVSPYAGWGEIIRRSRKWFDSESILFLNGGITVPHFHFRKLAECALHKKSCYGKVLDVDKGSVSEPVITEFTFTTPLDEKLPEYFLLDNSAGEQVSLEGVEDLLLHAALAVDSELSAPEASSQSTPDIPTGLPAQIDRAVKEIPNVCFWGRGQSLDIQGREKNPLTAELIIYRISITDIRGLSAVIKEHTHDRLKKVIALFDNSMMQLQGDTPFGAKGVQPVDVVRELQLAGHAIQHIDAYDSEPKEIQSLYSGVSSKTEFFTREETLYATAEKILIEATPCSSAYDLTKKVSIIMLALNKVEYTRECIESIQKYTQQSYELILVNNGSTDGTKEYFDSIPGAVVIHNTENRGVAAGWNQGIDKATGEYVLVFNNDTIVGTNSIENLVRAAINHPTAGIIAPRSNAIAGPQMVEGFTYQDKNEIPGLIHGYQEANDLASWEFTRIKGFCMLMSKETVAQIGYFDEQFGYGNFEDDDYSCRVLYSDKKLLVANDSFIFHYGSVSFGQANCDWNELMAKNQKLFSEKWKQGRATVHSSQGVLPGIPALPSISGALKSEGTSDFNAIISDIKKSTEIKNIVQESEDLAKNSPAWSEFTAGNLDAANELFLSDLQNNEHDASIYYGMGLIAQKQNRQMDAYTFFCRGLEVDSQSKELAESIVEFLKENSTQSDMEKVVDVFMAKYPNNAAFMSLKDECSAEHVIELDGSWSETVEALVEAREFVKANAILHQKKSSGEEGFEVYNLMGIIAYYQEMYDEAFKHFEKALKYKSTDEDTLLNYYDAGVRLKLWDRIIEVLEYGLAMNPDMEDVRRCYEEARNARGNRVPPEELIYNREMNIGAETLIREGMLEKANDVVDGILEKDTQNFRALNNKGLILWYQNRRTEAWDLFKKSLDVNIWYTDAIINMYDCSLLIDKRDEFSEYLNRALEVAPANKELLSMKSELQQAAIPSRLNVYFEEETSDAVSQKVGKAKALVESQEYEAAVLIFTEVLNQEPDNVDCYNGLGIIAFYWRNYQDAFKLISRAVELKPLDQDSLLNLWDVAQKIDREAEVREVLQTAITLDPSMLQVAEVLQ